MAMLREGPKPIQRTVFAGRKDVQRADLAGRDNDRRAERVGAVMGWRGLGLAPRRGHDLPAGVIQFQHGAERPLAWQQGAGGRHQRRDIMPVPPLLVVTAQDLRKAARPFKVQGRGATPRGTHLLDQKGHRHHDQRRQHHHRPEGQAEPHPEPIHERSLRTASGPSPPGARGGPTMR